MSSTPNASGGSDPLLDREDLQAIGNSSSHQWNQISYLLGLPQLNTLAGSERAVVTGITDVISRVRGNVTRAGIEQAITTDFHEQVGRTETLDPAANAAALTAAAHGVHAPHVPSIVTYSTLDHFEQAGMDRNVALADAWLKVIYRHITEQDLRQILDGLRGQMIYVNPRSPTTPAEWGEILSTGEAFTLDLSHPAWKSGSVDSIKARLLNRVPSDVGVTIIPAAGILPPPALTDAIINDILKSQNEIQISRNDPSVPLVVQRVTLEDAIKRRAPIEQLFNGATDPRELMLALAEIQRDPATINAISGTTANSAALQKELVENDRLLHIAHTVKNLQSLSAPKFSPTDITNGMNAMTKIIDNITLGLSMADQEALNVFDGSISAPGRGIVHPGANALSAAEIHIANTLGIKSALQRKLVPAVHHPTSGAVMTAAQDNIDVFTKVAENAQKMIAEYKEAEKATSAIKSAIETMASELKERKLVPDVAQFGLLHEYIDFTTGTPPTYAIKPTAVYSKFNPTAFIAEYNRALLTVDPTKPVALKTVEEYEKKRGEIGTKIGETAGTVKGLNGSEACWAVIRRGLENQGLAGKELEDTLGYMRARVQRNPQSTRDINTLAASLYQLETDEHDALHEDQHLTEHWNEHHSMAGGFGTADYLTTYRNNLFTTRNIGMTLRDNPLSPQFQISTLVHAYFRTKYLTELPDSDPNHLPKTSHVLSFMYRLHRAILQRSQESFHKASGMNGTELQQLRALGMEMDPKATPQISIEERILAVHAFLAEGEGKYVQRHRSDIEKMATRANTIHKDKKWRNDLLGNLTGAEPNSWNLWGNTVNLIRRGVGGGASASVSATKGVASFIGHNKGAIGAAAIAGTVLIPIPIVGTAVGAAAGALYGWFRGEGSGGDAHAAESHPAEAPAESNDAHAPSGH